MRPCIAEHKHVTSKGKRRRKAARMLWALCDRKNIMKLTILRVTYYSLFLLVAGTSYAEPTMTETLEEKYYSTLDGWVKGGGQFSEVQNTVVETCGKLVMLTVSASDKVAISTTQREEFHFRVDACTKMTVNRVHPQPEFENKEIVRMICDESKVVLFEKLCSRSGLR